MAFDWAARAAAVAAAGRACMTASDDRRTAESIARWQEAARAFHEAIAAAWPPGFWVAFSKAQRGGADGAELELLVDFLEADPIFHRSGYIADKVVRFIGRSPLSPDHAARLRAVVLDAVDRRHRQYFRRFCALARRLDDEGLRAELARRVESADAKVALRAHWMLEGLELPHDAKNAPDYESLLGGRSESVRSAGTSCGRSSSHSRPRPRCLRTTSGALRCCSLSRWATSTSRRPGFGARLPHARCSCAPSNALRPATSARVKCWRR